MVLPEAAQHLVLGALIAAWALPALVVVLKGQYLLFFLGFLAGGILWWIVAFRLARPDSFWARRWYSKTRLDASRRRYG